MKTAIFITGSMALAVAFSACSNNGEGRFLNLTSGKEVSLVRDEEGRMVDEETRKPVLLYVDSKEKDTFYGITGEKVNGRLRRINEEAYVYNDGEHTIKIEGDQYKIEDGDTKQKWDGDEYKYKSDDVTVKREGGEYKVERDGYKKKVDKDGDVKIKTDDKKIKIDGETGERKVKERSIFSKVKEKVTGD